MTAARVAHLRHQRKLAERKGLPKFRDFNVLTEEEEYVLSRNFESGNEEIKKNGLPDNDHFDHNKVRNFEKRKSDFHGNKLEIHNNFSIIRKGISLHIIKGHKFNSKCN